ncbi:helix-turn-helix transcriptional regulator [Paenibacillus spongiae]|uniref:Helix-turn-helix transcriptional regulator n=1 Tax=Paenibacillus spongiae TaxID=2909671 RepID=A0ABY5S1I2_9BACL|nr:AraC family transcriptional regulator [Paenibacillus spongiae]UVI27410.1 helix-turn-helix transcriptional regulator [Paenibacillus spongiae]
MLTFMQLAQFREIRPHIRFAHYTEDLLKVPSRYIRDHEIILIDKGCGTLFTEIGSFPYKEQSLLIIPPGILHSFKDDPDASLGHAHWAVHFDWEPYSEEDTIHIIGDEEGPILLDEVSREVTALNSLWVPNMVRIDGAGEDIMLLMRQVVEAFRDDRPFRKLELQSSFLQLLLTLSKQIHDGSINCSLLTARKKKGKPKDRSDITKYILKMHAVVRQNFVSDSILNEWQETVFFSAPHFHRLFKEQTGSTPLEYFTMLRMEKGAQLLLSTKLPVQDVAYACGYEDSKYFSRLFRQYEGFSPKQYRHHFLRQK